MRKPSDMGIYTHDKVDRSKYIGYIKDYAGRKLVKGGKDYNCPACTGINKLRVFDNGFCCIKCGAKGSVYDLVGIVENIEGFIHQYKYIEGLYGERKEVQRVTPYISSRPAFTKPVGDYTKFINWSRRNLKATDYFLKRGISYETAKLFGCGYIKDFKFNTLNEAGDKIQIISDRAIIPAYQKINGKLIATTYIGRETDAENHTEYKKIRRGSPLIINFNKAMQHDIIFVTEGEFDILSAWEAGIHNVCCLCGVGNVDKFIKEVEKKMNEIGGTEERIIVPLLDNDRAGAEASEAIVRAFKGSSRIGIALPPVSELYSGHNDLNEALVCKRVTTINKLQELNNFERLIKYGK